MIATQQQQLYILKTLSKPQLQCILEIIFNVMQGVVSLTEHDKAQLKRRKRFIRAVIATRVIYARVQFFVSMCHDEISFPLLLKSLMVFF
jgi:hypothetical protein